MSLSPGDQLLGLAVRHLRLPAAMVGRPLDQRRQGAEGGTRGAIGRRRFRHDLRLRPGDPRSREAGRRQRRAGRRPEGGSREIVNRES